MIPLLGPLLPLLLKSGLTLAAGAAAKHGLEYLEEKTGVKLDPSQEELTPDQHAAISQAQEDNFDEWFEIRKLQLEMQDRSEQRDFDNVEGARKMQIAALGSDSQLAKEFIYWFILAWSVFSMIYILVITLAPIPESNVRTVDTVTGWLIGTAMAGIFSFLLGTTVRNKQKDETINILTKERSNG